MEPTAAVGIELPAQGLGCMGMSGTYGAADWDKCVETIHLAGELGASLLDTADVYGFGHNEVLVGRAICGRRDSVLIATKFGIDRSGGAARLRVRGDSGYIRQACEQSLLRLGVETIDLYLMHRPSAEAEIEESVAAMAGLVQAGKVRFIGLCAIGEEQLRRACAVHPVAVVQNEYSLWARETEQLMPVLAELGVALVAYSPLGRGFFTGTLNTASFAHSDTRRLHPRLTGQAGEANQALVGVVREVADELGVRPAQVALAWLYARASEAGVPVIPIPGAKRPGRIVENVAALDVRLRPQDLDRLDGLASMTVGELYDGGALPTRQAKRPFLDKEY